MNEPHGTEGTTRRLPVIEKADAGTVSDDAAAGGEAADRDPDQSASAYHPPPAPEGGKGESGGERSMDAHGCGSYGMRGVTGERKARPWAEGVRGGRRTRSRPAALLGDEAAVHRRGPAQKCR